MFTFNGKIRKQCELCCVDTLMQCSHHGKMKDEVVIAHDRVLWTYLLIRTTYTLFDNVEGVKRNQILIFGPQGKMVNQHTNTETCEFQCKVILNRSQFCCCTQISLKHLKKINAHNIIILMSIQMNRSKALIKPFQFVFTIQLNKVKTLVSSSKQLRNYLDSSTTDAVNFASNTKI